MPLLRLQQPCPRPSRSTRSVSSPPSGPRSPIAPRTTPGRVVRSIFFGGGTPSLMRPQTVQAMIDAIADAWTLAPDAEITLEANPTSVEAGRFRGYRAAGVNRLSIGVQALNDADLKALGRRHTVAEALAAVKIAAVDLSAHTRSI